MGKGKLGKNGWEVPEDGKDSKGILVQKVSDKDAAKVGKYRELEKECGQLKDMVKQGGDQIAELQAKIVRQDDKLLQVFEFGITFNDDGVLIPPESKEDTPGE